MGFAEFTTPDALKQLDGHLAGKSYVDGYQPSQADVSVYKALPSAPDAAQYPHAARWYKHIASYESSHATLAGDAARAFSSYGPAVASTSTAEPVDATEAKAKAPAADEDDDEIDLFGSDDEDDAAAEELKAKRVAEYTAKKANKPKTIAKSLVTLDVKPWDDETDMKALEAFVRSIEQPGLVWGLSKLVPVGYGVSKMQISVVVEDDLVSLEDLQERLADEGEEFIQSTDIQAMAKL